MAWQSDTAWGGFASFSWKDEESDSRLLVKTLWRTGFSRNKNNSTACSSPTPALPVQHLQQGGPPSRHPKPFLEGAPPSQPRTCHKAFLYPTRDTSSPLKGVAAPQLAPWSWGRGMGGRKGALLLCSPAVWRRCLGAGAHEDLWLCHTPPRRAAHCYPVTLKSLSAQASLR